MIPFWHSKVIPYDILFNDVFNCLATLSTIIITHASSQTTSHLAAYA